MLRISVIIPCHNASRWVSRTLLSVQQQQYPVHEVIVVDDDSTDDSIRKISESGVVTKLLQVKARNAAAARNAGIEVASGDWIALLDADDIWYPNHLDRAALLLEGSNDIAFMSNHDWIGLDDELLPMPEAFRCKLEEPSSGLDVDQFFELLTTGFHFGHSTVLYRLDRLRAVGMFDPTQRRRHDSDLWIRMVANHTWTYDTVKSVGYRENTPDSLSKAEMECDYFYLRSLVKNAHLVQSNAYRVHLAREARRAMGISFVDGYRDNYAAIRDLAWEHLPPHYRLFYICASIWPGLAQRLIRAKRNLSSRRAAT